jgi:hypothetical protein
MLILSLGRPILDRDVPALVTAPRVAPMIIPPFARSYMEAAMRKPALALLSVAIVFAVAAPAVSQEKVGDKRVTVVTKLETITLPDVDGHVLNIAEAKGYDLTDRNVVVIQSVADLIKGNGRAFGYGKGTTPAGDVFLFSSPAVLAYGKAKWAKAPTPASPRAKAWRTSSGRESASRRSRSRTA